MKRGGSCRSRWFRGDGDCVAHLRSGNIAFRKNADGSPSHGDPYDSASVALRARIQRQIPARALSNVLMRKPFLCGQGSLFVVNRNVVEALARKEGDGAERRQRRSRIAPRCNTCTGGKNLPPVGRPRARFAPLSNAESHHLFRIYIHHRGLEGQTDLRQGTRPTPSLDGMDKGRA